MAAATQKDRAAQSQTHMGCVGKMAYVPASGGMSYVEIALESRSTRLNLDLFWTIGSVLSR